jgi:DNA-binding transcriptional LysR family regulator
LCARDLADGALVRVCADWRIATAPVWALTSSSAAKTPTLRAFVELLQARIRADRLVGAKLRDSRLRSK